MKKEKEIKVKQKNKVFKTISNFFVNIGKKIANFFKYLIPLTAMQLKDQKDFGHYKKKRHYLFKIVYSMIIFIIVTMAINILLTLVVKFELFSFIQILNYRAYLVLMTVLFILSFIACLVKVTQTLYFSKDNTVLITMPVTNGLIFTSKLIVCFVYELIKNLSWLLPFFFAYGMNMGLPITFYLWSVLSVIIFTLLCVVICGLLSIPAMMITILLKKHKILEYILVIAFVSFAVFALITLFNAIPQNIDIIRDWGTIYWSLQDFLAAFAKYGVVFDRLLQLFTGMVYNGLTFTPITSTNINTLQICFGVIVISLTLTYLLAKPLFLKMISSPFEYKKKINKVQQKNRKKSPFISAVFQQVKRVFRSPNILYSVVAVAIITPLSVFLQNKIIGAMDTRMFGNHMGVTFNILIIALLTLASNYNISSIYSKEGNSAYLNKVNPVPFFIPLSAKVVFNAGLNCISIIVSCVIINAFANIGVANTIYLTLGLLLLYLGHLFWSAELDIMNPQNQHYQTTGSHNKNPNETKSTLIAFIASALFCFATFTFIQEDPSTVFLKTLLFTGIFFVIRTYLYFTRIKLYYKEK